MARLTVEAKGGDRIVGKLKQIAGRLERNLQQAVAEEAEEVARDERNRVPVDQGNLRDGIEVHIDGDTAEVGPRNPALYYAVFIEWGRTRAAAQPFATPAAEASRARFPRRVRGAAQESLDG